MLRTARALLKVLNFFGWDQVAVLYTDDMGRRKCYNINNELQDQVRLFKKSVIYGRLFVEI